MHKTFIGGTSYNISRGKSLIGGTTYNISAGKTLVNGTSYNIGFGPGSPTALLYTDNEIVFQTGGIPASNRSLVAKYSNVTNVIHSEESTIPWKGYINTINKISFNGITPTAMDYWFSNAQKLKTCNGVVTQFKDLTSMVATFQNCSNFSISPFAGPQVKNMYKTYANCTNLTGPAFCGANTTNFAYCYISSGVNSAMVGENVTNMAYAFKNCLNLTGSVGSLSPNKVVNMAYAFQDCQNLAIAPKCGTSVQNMAGAYYNCRKLKGSPVCGSSVTRLDFAYNFCVNLTGSPACGNSVTNMRAAYQNCYKLNGKAVCGPNVTDMSFAYFNCQNLTGSAVCGPKVTAMIATYANCQNLSGSVWVGKNVQNMQRTYQNTWCYRSGNIYILSPNVTNATNAFGRYTGNYRINIFIPANSTTQTTFTQTTAGTSLTNGAITWTTDNTNGYIYNSSRNLYLYPVANVEQMMAEHGFSQS